jgi:hypothetical protein
MDLYHLRQGLHVIASSWDYHGGAESRVSVRGNSGRYNIFWGSTIFLGTILTWNAQIPFVSARTTLAIIRFHDLQYDTWNLESVLYIFYNSALVHMLACFSGNNGGGSFSHNDRI